MRNSLLLIGLILFSASASAQQSAATSQPPSPVVVLEFKWSKTRQTVQKSETVDTGPARAVIPQNKNYQRNARINDPAGARDPNLDTTDGRAAALEKAVQESRQPPPKVVDAFAYKLKVHNTSDKVLDILFWEYQFVDPANPEISTRRQFLCGLNVKPGKYFDVQAVSLLAPSEVVSVASLENKTDGQFRENAVINRVEFADGTVWQRKSWNSAEIKAGYTRAVSTPWGKEMCRSL